MSARESGIYRRGLTLGLTMAEIFILILFLLLLLLLALYASHSKSKSATGTMAEQLAEARAELRAVTAQHKYLREQLPKEIQELAETNEALQENLAAAEAEVAAATEAFAQTADELQQTQQDNAQLREELFANSKGIDPPCWYFVAQRQGKRYEKPYYLMSIAVHDDRLRVLVRDPPPGAAIDENGTRAPTNYREEYARLPLAPLRSAEDLSLAAFSEIANPIRRMGKSEEIRDYSCVFYVAVWDMTGAEEKDRWKKATAAIKGSFYVYEVRDDPWPADARN